MVSSATAVAEAEVARAIRGKPCAIFFPQKIVASVWTIYDEKYLEKYCVLEDKWFLFYFQESG